VTTYEARAGFAVVDALRAVADDLRSVAACMVTTPSMAHSDLLYALADMLDQPPNATREDVQQETVRLLRGMCNHD